MMEHHCFTFENKETKYICIICEQPFWDRKRKNKPKFCSDTCREEGWKRYMKKYMRRKRLVEKLRNQDISIEELDKMLGNFIREEKNITKWTEDMSERMKYLVTHQQFAEDIPEIPKVECWVCRSKEKLIIHHIKYYPIIEVKILCRSCSEFLHKALLKGKKCRPKWFR